MRKILKSIIRVVLLVALIIIVVPLFLDNWHLQHFFMDDHNNAKIKLNNIKAKQLEEGLLEFFRRHNRLPEKLTDLSDWHEEDLLDVWGSPWQYENNNGNFKLYSLGADNKIGGENEDEDIVIFGPKKLSSN